MFRSCFLIPLTNNNSNQYSGPTIKSSHNEQAHRIQAKVTHSVCKKDEDKSLVGNYARERPSEYRIKINDDRQSVQGAKCKSALWKETLHRKVIFFPKGESLLRLQPGREQKAKNVCKIRRIISTPPFLQPRGTIE